MSFEISCDQCVVITVNAGVTTLRDQQETSYVVNYIEAVDRLDGYRSGVDYIVCPAHAEGVVHSIAFDHNVYSGGRSYLNHVNVGITSRLRATREVHCVVRIVVVVVTDDFVWLRQLDAVNGF